MWSKKLSVVGIAWSCVLTQNPAAAQDWIQTSATNTSWTSIASSADGIKLAATTYDGGIWISTNSGTNWKETTAPETSWTSIASSTNGSILVAAGGGKIYISINSGTVASGHIYQRKFPNASWKATSGRGTSVACSWNGKKLVVGGDLVYVSTDSGVSWKPTRVSGARVLSSADGNKLLVADHEKIYVSANSGTTWKTNTAPTDLWGIAASADLNKVVGVSFDTEQIYTSSDSGATWQTVGPNDRWLTIASSADGTELLARIQGGTTWASSDSGTTWVPTSAPYDWQWCMASSADGTQWVVASSDGGGIWIWRPTVPMISTQPTNQAVLVGANVRLDVGVSVSLR